MKPQRPFSRLPALALLLVGLTKPAPAFVQLNPPSVWPDGDIVMHLQLGPLSRALGDGSPSWNAAAKTALEAWNPHMERAKFTTVMDSTVPIGSGNGVSNVIFSDSIFGRAFGDSVLAVNQIIRIGSRRIEADTVFNTKYTWDSYRGPLRPGTNTAEFMRVAIHEFGHALGLGHPDQDGQSVAAIMNSTAGNVDGLLADDINGARFIYADRAGLQLPSVLIPLASTNVVAGATIELSVTVAGTPPFQYVWTKDRIRQINQSSKLTLANAQTGAAGTYAVTVTNPGGSVTSEAVVKITSFTAVPVILNQPTNVTARAGFDATLSVNADGTSPLRFQWFKNGAPVGPLSESNALTLSSVQLSDAGSYSVTATNSAGSVTSNAATLAVTAEPVNVGPSFTTQPVGRTINAGSTVVFSSLAAGTPNPTYQWRQNGTIISGATLPNLVLSRADLSAAGNYTCTATNSVGSATSNSATLSIAPIGTEPSRLDGLSVLTTLATGEPFFTVATVIGGAGTVGLKPLLVRASGPTLGSPSFGIPGTLPDPRLELFSPPTSLATNDNWGTPAGNVPGISAAIASRAIFPFFAANSRDAAVYNSGLPAGNYTVQVGDTGGGTGLVLAEIYDAGTGAFSATTPRLVSVAVLKAVSADGLVTLGFNIGGTTAKTVLIRALGPTLGALFNLPDAMPDPRVAVFAAQATTPFAVNDNWGGDAQILTLNNLVTFPPASAASRDAILILTLNRGGYTVEARPVSGSPGGSVLAEVYELP
jgi:hypothetical protein